MRTVTLVHAVLATALLIVVPSGCIKDSVVGLKEDVPTDTGGTSLPPVPTVTSVSISPATVSIDSGDAVTLTATVRDQNGSTMSGQTVSWSSSAPAIATVDGAGVVHALATGDASVTASLSGKSNSAPVHVKPRTLRPATVTVSPSTASLDSGATLTLTATVRDGNGTVMTNVSVSWGSSAPLIAPVDGSGLVRALRSGNATITAAVSSLSSTAAIAVKPPAVLPPATVNGYFMSPSGSSSGDGSASRPWDLGTVLRNPSGKILPGDTIWMRGGRYTGIYRNELDGTAANPIVIREYPGEHAIVDGFIEAYGSYTVFWGFEITQTNPLSTAQRGIDARGPGHRFINLIIHDVGGSGIGFWMEGVDAEVYGCIVYNNGFESSLHHGIYVINRDGTKTVENNVIFDNYAYGMQVYGTGPGQSLNNVHVIGNTLFNNGSISTDVAKPNLLVGGSAIVARGMVVKDNTLYYSYDADAINLRLGYDGSRNEDIVVTNNYATGGQPVVNVKMWNTMTMTGNTFIGSHEVVHLDQKFTDQWTSNSWFRDPMATAWSYGSQSLTFAGWQQATGLSANDAASASTPTGVRVVVQPNRYEQGRAHVVVNNWNGQASATADVSTVLRSGDHYEVRSVQDLFGTPLATGTYAGGSIQIPLRAIAPPRTVGRTDPLPPTTGPKFDVYLVRKVP